MKVIPVVDSVLMLNQYDTSFILKARLFARNIGFELSTAIKQIRTESADSINFKDHDLLVFCISENSYVNNCNTYIIEIGSINSKIFSIKRIYRNYTIAIDTINSSNARSIIKFATEFQNSIGQPFDYYAIALYLKNNQILSYPCFFLSEEDLYYLWKIGLEIF